MECQQANPSTVTAVSVRCMQATTQFHGVQLWKYKHWFHAGYWCGDGALVTSVEHVARELRSSSSAIRAIDWQISLFSTFLYISELSDLNSMATYSPYVSKSSGSVRIKFNAWLRHSSSDEMVLPDFCLFLFFGEDAGISAAPFAPSPEFYVTSSEASAGTTWNDKTKTSDLKYLILNKMSFFFSVTINNRRMAEM